MNEKSEISTLKNSCINLLISRGYAFFSQESSKTSIPKDLREYVEMDYMKRLAGLLDDKSVCKKMTLDELISEIDKIFVPDREGNEREKWLFLALKKIEKEILDITANPLFRDGEREELKIDLESIGKYCKKKFGISGMIHSFSVECAFGYNGSESRAKEFAVFAAFEKFLQSTDDLNGSKQLTLVNSLFENGIIEMKKEIHGLFKFKDNQLKFIIDEGEAKGEYNIEQLHDLACSVDPYPETFKKLVVEEVGKILNDPEICGIQKNIASFS